MSKYIIILVGCIAAAVLFSGCANTQKTVDRDTVVRDYVAAHITDVEALYADITTSLGASNLGTIQAGLSICADEYQTLTDSWKAVPAGSSKVTALENAYARAGSATGQLIQDGMDILSNNAPSDAKLTSDVIRENYYIQLVHQLLGDASPAPSSVI